MIESASFRWRLSGQQFSCPLGYASGVIFNSLPLLPIELINALHDGQESSCGATVAVAGRPIRAAKERLGLGRQKHGQRPATAASANGQQGVHIDLIDIRSLLAVDFDAEEMFVEEASDFGVQEGFAFHHMAPVATGVTDGEKDWLVEFLRLGQRFFVPRMPVDRIVGMHQQIRRALFG